MARLSKNLYVAYGGKTYTIPLYDTHDGMTAYNYIIVDGRQAYINLVAENSGLATTPLHIKEHTGSQFRVTDRQICKVTVQQSNKYQTLTVKHRGTTYTDYATFYAIAGESITVKNVTKGDHSHWDAGDIIINGTDTNTTNYTFTIWGNATIKVYGPESPGCGDSSGCGGEGG